MHETIPTSQSETSQLNLLVQQIQNSSRYKDVCSELIQHIGRQELSKRHTLKEAVKATKNKLHQIGGAYQDGREDYQHWLQLLTQAQQEPDETALREVCQQLMSYHVSTRERLTLLPHFYQQIFSLLPPIHSVIDIACGLNPLALPWMPLAAGASYYAYDIYQQMMDFLNSYLQLSNRAGEAKALDVVQSCPTQPVDLVLLLKVLPCLEQIEKQAAQHLLHSLRARYLVISYPIHSLGGKHKGMASYYEQHFHSLINATNWNVQKITFASELVFIVTCTAVD